MLTTTPVLLPPDSFLRGRFKGRRSVRRGKVCLRGDGFADSVCIRVDDRDVDCAGVERWRSDSGLLALDRSACVGSVSPRGGTLPAAASAALLRVHLHGLHPQSRRCIYCRSESGGTASTLRSKSTSPSHSTGFLQFAHPFFACGLHGGRYLQCQARHVLLGAGAGMDGMVGCRRSDDAGHLPDGPGHTSDAHAHAGRLRPCLRQASQ